MKHLFEDWPVVLAQLLKAKHILLLLDYDGTLTPIAPTPDKAVLDNGMRDILQSLARKGGVRLGIISGRKLSEIQGIIGVAGIYYAGNHGLEMEGPNLNYLNPQGRQSRAYLARIFQAINEGLGQMDGLILEDKGYSLSLHYRLVESDYLPEVKEVFSQICEPYVRQGQIRITEGKRVLEVMPPVDWNKGKALLMLRDFWGGASAPLTIYVGDDQTDEDAFSVLGTGTDISVLVGDPGQVSKAKYYLEDVPGVREFLLRLKELP